MITTEREGLLVITSVQLEKALSFITIVVKLGNLDKSRIVTFE